MKKIVLHATSFDGFWAHYLFFKDKHFVNRLNSLGYDFYLSDQTELGDADLILFLEATSAGLQHFGFSQKLKKFVKSLIGKRSIKSRDLYKECCRKHLLDKTALIAAESTIHLPENHLPVLAKKFRFIFTWNDTLVDGIHFLKVRIPQPVEWPVPDKVPFEKRKLLVNISANKYHKSNSELYTARRRSIQYFEEVFKDQFDLFGIGWNKPASTVQKLFIIPFPYYKSYRGTIRDKSEVYPNYRFSLCYENACVPGYVTEKIFDCLRSDCIPIYLGAPNIGEYVPKNVFIDRRQFDTEEDLAGFLLNLSKEQFNQYLLNIREYLSGAQFKSFLATDLAENIVTAVERI